LESAEQQAAAAAGRHFASRALCLSPARGLSLSLSLSSNHLPNTNLKLERLAAVVRSIELFAIRQRPPVMHRQGIALTHTHYKKIRKSFRTM